ncbi:MAG: hypothetical protein JW929_15905 [Anaerolineales bacterium]|nr:hypothetical protein [Anaerolineales bacterium]
MKRFPADGVIAAVLVLAFAALAVGTALISPGARSDEPPLSSTSYQRDGAKALSLWLETQNFRVNREVVPDYEIPPDVDVVLLLQPSVVFTPEEQYALWNWVLSGGHLVIAGDSPALGQVYSQFDLELVRLPVEAEWLYLDAPILRFPPVEMPVHARAEYGIRERRRSVQVHSSQGDIPTTIIHSLGDGTVAATTAGFAFSNSGILESGNPQFVYNLIAYPGGSRTVWFDEWHHGVRLRMVDRLGPLYWLFDTAAGRGVLFAVTVVWIGLLLAGRPFGRPLRASPGESHRAPVEYAGAIARLRRRAGHRRIALAHFHQALKKGLGLRHSLDPSEDDDRFVDELKKRRPELAAPRLRRLLRRLSKERATEREMVVWAQEAADWIDRRE